ncbi:hypothetical protein ES708_21575 [subsurface metagenome]
MRRVEHGQEQRHAGPHAGLDGAEEQAQHVVARRVLHADHRGADDADADDDAREPDGRGELAHGEVRRDFEHDVGDVEEREACGDLVRGEVEAGSQVVAFLRVHGLREADVGAHGGAQEVEEPEGRDDSEV